MYDINDEKEVFLAKPKKKAKKPWIVEHRYTETWLSSHNWWKAGKYATEKDAREAMRTFRKNRCYMLASEEQSVKDVPLEEGIYDHFEVWYKRKKREEFRLRKVD